MHHLVFSISPDPYCDLRQFLSLQDTDFLPGDIPEPSGTHHRCSGYAVALHQPRDHHDETFHLKLDSIGR